jgi:exonuclease III
MAFRTKAKSILKFKPDILIIPECEHPDKLKFTGRISRPTDILWFGSNQHKGLGIFSYSDYKFKLLDEYNPDFKLVIPISVYNTCGTITLYAIWANNPSDREGRYVTQVWKAINYYDSLLTNEKIILIGDFNSNTIWDRPRRQGNHSTVVTFLENKGIYSTYHRQFNIQQGREEHPTFYLYKQKQKPYHIDYCFASQDLIEKLQSVEIGSFKAWRKYSDHVPVIVSFNF